MNYVVTLLTKQGMKRDSQMFNTSEILRCVIAIKSDEFGKFREGTHSNWLRN